MNELQQLKESSLYSWATLEPSQYLRRLGLLWLFFFSLVGGPIAYQTFDPLQQPLEFFLSGATGAFVVVAIAVVRIYLGWSYVGNRLLSASIPYEETGWYDGQTYVKPVQVLARDRLLGTYEVKPVLAKLKGTLIGSGVALATLSLSLAAVISASTDADGVYGRGAARKVRQTQDGTPVFSSKVYSPSQLLEDDQLASEEAAAQVRGAECSVLHSHFQMERPSHRRGGSLASARTGTSKLLRGRINAASLREVHRAARTSGPRSPPRASNMPIAHQSHLPISLVLLVPTVYAIGWQRFTRAVCEMEKIFLNSTHSRASRTSTL